MKNELISIIVPVYKVEKYLDGCLESIVNQTYQNLEILLVDDGSPDNCPRLCDEWAQKDSRIKVIHQSNGGLSAARNAALKVAAGEYYAFVDSDDYIEDTLCEQVMNVFAKHDVDIVVFDCWRVDEENNKLGSTEKITEGVLGQESALAELMKGNINNYICNKIYSKKVFEGMSFPVGRLWEDVATAYKLFMKAEHIYCLPEKLYYYLQRVDSITNTINEKGLESLFLARHSSYLDLKEVYPNVGEMVFSKVALCAIRLYDRSLWAEIDPQILKEARAFLAKNRNQILNNKANVTYMLYYRMPKVYDILRKAKHLCGNLLRK